jgi:anaerobic ribonucleoside-triphosphate reductase activating protein
LVFFIWEERALMQGRIKRICTSFIDVPHKIAVAVYFAGCSIRCSGCQNKELWDPMSGEKMSADDVFKKIQQHSLAEYVVFLGGEPTDQMDFLMHVCMRVMQELHLPIALYTGREFEILPPQLVATVDLIVCGPYRQELHVGGWPASSNQRIFRKESGQWKL